METWSCDKTRATCCRRRPTPICTFSTTTSPAARQETETTQHGQTALLRCGQRARPPWRATARASPLNLYRVLPHAPEIALGFLGLGRAILTEASLPPTLRELVILRVGALSGASYEVHQHRRVACAAGVPEEKSMPC
ncbi:carboxymuconolactone decarboxylase family protein [Cupriavidus basilensis]